MRRLLGGISLIGLVVLLAGATLQPGSLQSVGSVTTLGHVTSTLHVTGTIRANTGSGNMACHSVATFAHSGTAFNVLHATTGLKFFICGITIVAAHQTAISVVEGTDATCSTGVTPLIGAPTAAGGIVLGAATPYVAVAPFPWVATRTAGNGLCILSTSSGATRIGGSISYSAVP